MEALRVILRALSRSTDPVGPGNSKASSPGELTVEQLGQVAGGGGAAGGVVKSGPGAGANAQPFPDAAKVVS